MELEDLNTQSFSLPLGGLERVILLEVVDLEESTGD